MISWIGHGEVLGLLTSNTSVLLDDPTLVGSLITGVVDANVKPFLANGCFIAELSLSLSLAFLFFLSLFHRMLAPLFPDFARSSECSFCFCLSISSRGC